MDYELTANEGHHVAHNQALHSSFSHRANGLVISERGTNIFSAVDVTDESLKAMDRQESLFDVGADRLVQAWMNNVANAASQAGAADTESPVALDNGVSELSGSGSISQIVTEVMGSLDDEAMTEGEVLKKAEINKALVAFMTCQGLPARLLNNVYSRHFFSIFAPHWDMSSAST